MTHDRKELLSGSQEIEHAPEIKWSNIINEWCWSCSCGQDFGCNDELESLASRFDVHIAEIRAGAK